MFICELIQGSCENGAFYMSYRWTYFSITRCLFSQTWLVSKYDFHAQITRNLNFSISCSMAPLLHEPVHYTKYYNYDTKKKQKNKKWTKNMKLQYTKYFEKSKQQI